jgi:large conductance mechanosensitive channel
LIDDVKDFLGRASVLELFLAVLFASAAFSFVQAIVTGVVFRPITQGTGNHSSWSELTVAIDGRAFDFSYVLVAALTVALVSLLAIPLIRRSDEALWDDRELRTCPHCLSEIPKEASVCSYCTRDVA